VVAPIGGQQLSSPTGGVRVAVELAGTIVVMGDDDRAVCSLIVSARGLLAFGS